MQLADIMLNVQRIINRYTLDENVHSGRKISITEYKKRRVNFMEKIVTCAKNVEIREKTLVYILAWLEEWSKYPEVAQRKTMMLMKKLENRIYKL